MAVKALTLVQKSYYVKVQCRCVTKMHTLGTTFSTYSVFPHGVMRAMFVSLNKGTVAMLVSPTIPPGIELIRMFSFFFS